MPGCHIASTICYDPIASELYYVAVLYDSNAELPYCLRVMQCWDIASQWCYSAMLPQSNSLVPYCFRIMLCCHIASKWCYVSALPLFYVALLPQWCYGTILPQRNVMLSYCLGDMLCFLRMLLEHKAMLPEYSQSHAKLHIGRWFNVRLFPC